MNIPLVVLDGGCTGKASTFEFQKIPDMAGTLDWNEKQARDVKLFIYDGIVSARSQIFLDEERQSVVIKIDIFT